MNNKICTSIQQAQKLLEIGVDTNTADMLWATIYDENHMVSDYRLDVMPYRLYSGNAVPAWSLSALLYLLDNPQLFNHDDKWKCDGYTCIGYPHDNAIDAVFEVVELEAEKFQKGAKRHGIRRTVIRNK